MKAILSLIISGALVVSGYAQTRNVLVGTNNTVVQPTNFWSADASNARTGLGLGSAATNPASAFQPSSATLSNLASSNAVNLTNLRATNLIGLIPTSNIPSTTLTNISGTLAITQGGTGATNIGNARTNLGATSIGDAVFTATNAAAARTAIGALATNGDATNLTNFPANLLRTNGNGSGLANLTAANITGTVALASNVTGTIAVSNGGTGATNAATTRTNLGLGWAALTNTSASGFGAALYGSNTNPVLVNTNGEVVSPTNFWQRAPIQTTVQDFTGITVNQTNNATNARNVYVYSLATNVSGISNTIILPTNVSTFNGDDVTVVHKGTTNTTTVVRQAGSTNNLITLNKFDESVKFIRELGQWDFYHNISFVEPIQFSGTNAAGHAAESRTNLGLGTTNDVEFRTVKINLSTGAGDSLIVTNSSSSAVSTFDDIFVDELDAVSAAFDNTVIVSSSGISFNTNTAAAATRTNLGIPLAALTNTSATNFQKAIFYTNTAPSNIGGNLGTIAAWIEIVASNGVTYKVPAYTNVP